MGTEGTQECKCFAKAVAFHFCIAASGVTAEVWRRSLGNSSSSNPQLLINEYKNRYLEASQQFPDGIIRTKNKTR